MQRQRWMWRGHAGGVAVAVLALTAGQAGAAIIYVPDNYATIQGAIDAAEDGDEIHVRPDTYDEVIDFSGKAILVKSTDGAEMTTIDGFGLAAAVVTIDEGEGPDTILEGFTIKAGAGTLVGDLGITIGGGMLIMDSSPIVRDCTFEHNSAQSGGGLAVYLGGPPMIERCTFTDNEATLMTDWPDLAGGGGVLVHEAAATFTDCVLRSNEAVGGGAMVSRWSETIIRGTTFEENTSLASGSGGLFSYYGRTELRDSVFRANTTTGHVGGYGDNYGRVTVTGCDFIGNIAALSSGGALLWYTEQGSFTDCLFQENGAELYPGGGLGLGHTVATVQGSRFYDNYATANDGGGLAVIEGDFDVVSCDFARNRGRDGGGMISIATGYLAVTDSTFTDNEARSGGGMHLYRTIGDTAVVSCTFTGNRATAGGAGLMVEGPNDPVVLMASTFTDNNADLNGGGIGVVDAGLDIVGCLLARNSGRSGGAIYGAGARDVSIVATTIMDNTATNGGAMASFSSTEATFCNSILWNNTGGQIVNFSGSTSEVTYSDVQDGHAGYKNLDVDPLCVDPVSGDYRLLPESLCIDAGANAAIPVDDYDLDADGETTSERMPLDIDDDFRFADVDTKEDTGCGAPVIVDMGVYEYQGVPHDPMLMGDVNGDGLVDFADILVVLGDWGDYSDECRLGDTDLNWTVDFADLLEVLRNWS